MDQHRACEILFAYTGEGGMFDPATDWAELVEAAELLYKTMMEALPGRVGRATISILDEDARRMDHE